MGVAVRIISSTVRSGDGQWEHLAQPSPSLRTFASLMDDITATIEINRLHYSSSVQKRVRYAVAASRLLRSRAHLSFETQATRRTTISRFSTAKLLRIDLLP
jgi:hypothetical protein